MDSAEFTTCARALAGGLIDMLDRLPIGREDHPMLLAAALAEVLAQKLGGIPQAVERLRLVADVMERQAMDDMSASH